MPLTDQNRGRRTVFLCHVARATPMLLAPLMALGSLAAAFYGVTCHLGAERAGTVQVSATVFTHEYDRSLAAGATDGIAEEGSSGQQRGREVSLSECSSACWPELTALGSTIEEFTERSLAESEGEIQAGQESSFHVGTDATTDDHDQDGDAADSGGSRDGERRVRCLRSTGRALYCGGVGDGRRTEEQTGVAPGDFDDFAMVQKYYLKRNGVRYRLPKPKTKADKCVKAKAMLLPTAKVRPWGTRANGRPESVSRPRNCGSRLRLVDGADDDSDEGSFDEAPDTSARGSDDLASSSDDEALAPGLGSEDTVERMRQARQADAADPPMRRCSSKVIGKLSCGRWLSQAELKENFETCRSCRSYIHKGIESRSASSSEGMPGAYHGMSEAGNSLEPVDDSSFGHAVAEEHEEVGEESEEEEAYEEFSDDPDGVD